MRRVVYKKVMLFRRKDLCENLPLDIFGHRVVEKITIRAAPIFGHLQAVIDILDLVSVMLFVILQTADLEEIRTPIGSCFVRVLVPVYHRDLCNSLSIK